MRYRILLACTLLAATPALPQDYDPEVLPKKDVEGSPLYTVLPPDEIEAVYAPEFVFGEEAEAQMLADEPVLGVFDGVSARAYSLWQLNKHEVVDDMLGGTPIAATW